MERVPSLSQDVPFHVCCTSCRTWTLLIDDESRNVHLVTSHGANTSIVAWAQLRPEFCFGSFDFLVRLPIVVELKSLLALMQGEGHGGHEILAVPSKLKRTEFILLDQSCQSSLGET